jgi:tight adherence protein C
MRRTVAAEEGAARAGVMMIGPLMLIFACIMLIILGPFIVTSASGKGL